MLISSDTNIWLDIESIGHTEHPFLLNHKYYLSDVTYHDELNQSRAIHGIVESNHLLITNVSVEEMFILGNANSLNTVESFSVFSDYFVEFQLAL